MNRGQRGSGGRGRGRGSSGFGRGGGRGGFQQRDMGPPDTVLEMGTFVHAVEDEMLCTSLMPDKVPYFNAPIYLQNKSVIGKVDEILGPINEVYFSIKVGEGIVASSFKKGDKVYIGGDKLLPLERFLPKPKVQGGVQKRGSKGKAPGRGRGAGFGGGRGGPQRGGRGRGGGRGGFGGDRGRGSSRGGGFGGSRGRGAPRGGRVMTSKTLIAICGTTGVGKSRLAIELALSLPDGGAVINADAMQTYEGLDVLTNKIKREEQRGVKHSLMSFKKPGEQYVVGDWIQDANREIDSIHSRGKTPIVVGGTSYWIQHLLFSNGLPSQENIPRSSPPAPSPTLAAALELLPENLSQLFQNLPDSPPIAKEDPPQAFELYKLLSLLDPSMAARWHWKDTRKVLRNLEIIRDSGRPATEVLVETYKVNPTLGFKALVFWLYAKPEALEERLDRRVDDMLSQGLLDEIRSLQSLAQSGSVDYTSGIYQAIGYREFDMYLRSDEGNQQTNQKIYTSAVDQMKINTRKYARRQVKWIRNKLLPAVNESNNSNRGDENDANTISAYLLDASDLEKWETNVLEVAKNISRDFLTGSPLPEPTSISTMANNMLTVHQGSLDPSEVLKSRRKLICEVCTTDPEQPIMLEEGNEWTAHQRTKAHRRNANNYLQNNRDI